MNQTNKFKLLQNIPSYPAPVRLIAFLVVLLLLWLPFALPIYWFLGEDPNLVSILTMGLLYILFLGLLQWWGKNIYASPNLIKRYGLVWTKSNGVDFLVGLSLGFSLCWGLFIVQGIFGWLEWQSISVQIIRISLEGLLVACGVGLAEELVFRGWLVDELERDYRPKIVLWSSAIIFGLLHFLKPLSEVVRTLPQLPALIGLGLILLIAKRSHQNRLGITIGLHGGLVWVYYIINVGELIKYTQIVPAWITGIDGNPLAGVMGWLGLAILGFVVNYLKRA